MFLGSFNPSIFTPAWFGWNKLLPEGTVNVAELQIAQQQITSFRAEWLDLKVLPDRFSLNTNQHPFVRLRDLGVRIFREQLPHTPIHSMGINRHVHFLVKDQRERDLIGRRLAPVEPWGDWGEQLQPDGSKGGMTSITMSQIEVERRPTGGRINVTVQPSSQVGADSTGVYVEVNDHFTVENPQDVGATAEIVDLLEIQFEESISRSGHIIDIVMSLRED